MHAYRPETRLWGRKARLWLWRHSPDDPGTTLVMDIDLVGLERVAATVGFCV